MSTFKSKKAIRLPTGEVISPDDWYTLNSHLQGVESTLRVRHQPSKEYPKPCFDISANKVVWL